MGYSGSKCTVYPNLLAYKVWVIAAPSVPRVDSTEYRAGR
jgi:hypothetical protein